MESFGLVLSVQLEWWASVSSHFSPTIPGSPL